MQLEVGTTKATVWYMLMCSNRCIVTEQELDIPSDMTPLSSALWSAEEACFMLDVKGNVYLVSGGFSYPLALVWLRWFVEMGPVAIVGLTLNLTYVDDSNSFR